MIILKAIAIDDEVLALKKMERFCSQIEYIDLVKTFNNPLEAYYFLLGNRVDIMFLDIRMEAMSGLELLGRLDKPPYTVLTTAFSQYSLKAFDLDVVDYLLKPIRPERFRVATDKVLDRVRKDMAIESDVSANQYDENDHVFLKSGYKKVKVFLKDILYIEGMKDYLLIKTHTRKIMVLQNFDRMLEMLPVNRFIRIHRSFIIAIDKVDSYSSREVYIKGRVLPVSKTYKKLFMDHVTSSEGSDMKQ